MRVLVTGGAGFIGRALVPQLLTAGHGVTLLRRDPDAPWPAELEPYRAACQTATADLRDAERTSQAVAAVRPEAVIHLAASGVTDPFLPIQTSLQDNLCGTLHLLEAAFAQSDRVQRLIVGRTPGELQALNHYAAAKAAAWSFCAMFARTRRWPIVGGMLFQVYGPGQPEHTLIPAALRAALAGRDFPMTAGTQRRDWIHVSDAAAGLAALLTADLPPGATVELGTGVPTAVGAVVHLIYELVGRGGRPLPGALPGRPGEAPDQCADLRQTQTQITWSPRVALRAGLAALIRLAE